MCDCLRRFGLHPVPERLRSKYDLGRTAISPVKTQLPIKMEFMLQRGLVESYVIAPRLSKLYRTSYPPRIRQMTYNRKPVFDCSIELRCGAKRQKDGETSSTRPGYRRDKLMRAWLLP